MRFMRRGIGVLTAAALFGATLGACAGDDATEKAGQSSGSAAGTSTDQVSVKDFKFEPRSIQIKSGATVTWTNRDDFDHSVQSDPLKLKGPAFGPDTAPATFAHRFDTPGTYPYVCGIHNSMTGTVVVS